MSNGAAVRKGGRFFVCYLLFRNRFPWAPSPPRVYKVALQKSISEQKIAPDAPGPDLPEVVPIKFRLGHAFSAPFMGLCPKSGQVVL